MITKWERRKNSNGPQSPTTTLPVDYLRLVEQTLTQALEPGLNELKKLHATSEFTANGAIFGDEVLLTITLSHGAENIAATTLYASADFNPNADQPGLEATLAACLDAAGSVFDYYLDTAYPERIEQLAHQSLGALEDAPFDWTTIEAQSEIQGEEKPANKVPVWVKIDKSNLPLEAMAEKWLMEHDPEYKSKLGHKEEVNQHESEDFLNERLDAIKKAGSGGTSGGSGPITH